MNKRLLDYSASDFLKAKPMELKQAILASEGRTIMAENVPSSCPYMGKSVTNAELERAAGADLILFNALDLFNRIRQKSPILYRWVMNAVRYEGYRW